VRGGIDHTGQHAEQDSRRGQHRELESQGNSEEVGGECVDKRG
jgi:hypothetical protein